MNTSISILNCENVDCVFLNSHCNSFPLPPLTCRLVYLAGQNDMLRPNTVIAGIELAKKQGCHQLDELESCLSEQIDP